METAQSHLAFFRLAAEPFAPTADPACFFASETHQACLRQVWSAIEGQHGAALVLGAIGAGKTMILRKLAAGILASGPSHRLGVVGAPMAAWTTSDLLMHILAQFEIAAPAENPAAMTEALVAHLVHDRAQNNTLIIDDAQNLNKRGQLELLRVLLNLELPQRKLLNLIFFAQPDWTQVLDAAPEFSQRISTVCWLKPLNLIEIRALVRFRLERAGVDTGRGPQFQEDAYREILEASNGAPRTIIHLCRNALQIAADQRTWLIDSVIIQEAAQRTWIGSPRIAQREEPAVEAAPAAEEPHAQQAPAAAPAPRREAPLVFDDEDRQPVIAPRDTTATDDMTVSREDRARQLLLRARSRKEGRS